MTTERTPPRTENSDERAVVENAPREDSESDAAGPSRRRLLKSGALVASGALVGGSGRVGASGSDDESDGTSDPRGAMFPYQFAPDARFTVVESDLEWRPAGVDDAYAAHVIEYERARSLRALFFAESTLDAGETFRTAERRASPLAGARRLVGVATESVDR